MIATAKAKTRIRITFSVEQYGELLRRTVPTVIRTEKEYDRITKVIDALVDKGDDATPEEEQLLDLLSLLTEQYDEEHYNFDDAPPHEILKFMMEARDLQQKDIVHLFGNSSGRASEAISGVRAISKNQAKALAAFFNVSAELFI